MDFFDIACSVRKCGDEFTAAPTSVAVISAHLACLGYVPSAAIVAARINALRYFTDDREDAEATARVSLQGWLDNPSGLLAARDVGFIYRSGYECKAAFVKLMEAAVREMV